MTAKRFRKLYGALMSKIMQDTNGAGRAIYAARHIKACNLKGIMTYQQAWDALLPLRKMYRM